MSQPPRSIQQYLDDLANPAMSDSLHSSTDTLVNPDTPTQPLDTIRQEDLSTIPLSLQLAFAPRSHTPITTEHPNAVRPQPQYPNTFTHRPLHPCGLLHEGPCPAPVNSRSDYDTIKDALQSWTSRSRPKHPYRPDRIPTTRFIPEPHTAVSQWRSWNPIYPGSTASCNDSSIPLRWKKNNITWRKIASKGWQQNESDTPRGTNKIEDLLPLWTRSSILEQRGSATGLGY